MSRRSRPRFLLCLPLLLLKALPATPLPASDEPPALEALDGEPLTASDLEQGTTLLVVWASWSPRCRDVAPRIDRLAETWSASARVASVVFQEEPATVRAFLGGSPRVPVYLDASGDFCKRHRVTTLPMLLVFSGGELAFRGKLSANPDPLIRRVLEKRRPRPAAGEPGADPG